MIYPIKKIKGTLEKISKWYNGEVYKNSPNSGLVYIGLVYHPSAILARKTISFIRKEYKFLIGTIIAVIGLILMIIL